MNTRPRGTQPTSPNAILSACMCMCVCVCVCVYQLSIEIKKTHKSVGLPR